MKSLKFPINIYAWLYFKIHDFLSDHNLFSHYWLKKVGSHGEYYQCPYCHKVMEK